MPSIFEILTDFIKQLDDTAARELLARLCRAELRSQKLPESSVTWGGDQRAKDGGVDVRVDCPSPLVSPEFIKTPAMALQVKAEIFRPSDIEKEMAPKGKLRLAIRELAEVGGTYVIASSRDDVSDAALLARRTAMTECLVKFGVEPAKLQHDFYGSRHISDWVEQHPTIGNWLRYKIGQPLDGWRPYGPWAYNEHSLDAEYIIDDRARVFVPGAEDGSPISEAIGQLRNELRKSVSIRLVGLSGVGKTRLVQALFDDRVCKEGDVPPSENVIYTDLADKPEPQPTALIAALKERQSNAVVVVDNCGPDTHTRLTELVKQPDSHLKLITVEYDIRDDLPEGTQCYRLEGSSPQVITTLLKTRYPLISDSDADRIAEFSDGNARVAFALAATVEKGGELSRLRDADLFKRLFQQKNDPNEELLRCAEAASLLYSFDGEDLSGSGEIAVLASLAEVTPTTFGRHMAELKRRGLLQERGQWRAVLPHAVSNGLATKTLESFPADSLFKALVENASERMARSFSRRLGFLHESSEAVAIASRLLEAEGKLGDLRKLSEFESQMFANLAPVDQKGAIEALERATADGAFVSVKNHDRMHFWRTGRSLAYEAEHFDRAVSILMRFALAEPEGFNHDPVRDVLKSLFYCHLSGTQAPVEQRIATARVLLGSTDESESNLGFKLLEAGLEAWHFSSHHGFEFGARHRDYGWYPRTQAEVQNWYRPWIELAAEIGGRNDNIGRRARTILGEALRGLWGRVGLNDELMQVAERLRDIDGWPEGWLGTRRILQWDLDNLSPTSAAQLRELERSLAPSELASEIRASVLASGSFAFDLEDDDDDEDGKSSASEKYHRSEQKAEVLGVQAAAAPDVVDEILPDLLSRSGNSKPYSFGRGLGRTLDNQTAFLDKVSRLIANADSGGISLIWVRGFIKGWHKADPDAVQAFLDDAVVHPVWAESFVELQMQVDIDERGFERLKSVLENGSCPTWQFSYLAMGRATDSLSVAQIIDLANGILARPDDGFSVAIDLLAMVIHCTDKKDDAYKVDLSEALLDFIARIDWSRAESNHNTGDYDLGVVFNFAVKPTISETQILPVLQKLALSLKSELVRYSDPRKTAIKPFFRHFPRLALETICLPDDNGNYSKAALLLGDEPFERKESLMQTVPTDELIEWCWKSPEDRFPFAASTCGLFINENGEKKNLIVSPAAIALVAAAPDKEAVINHLLQRTHPRGFSGSLADILEERIPLLPQLNPDNDPAIEKIISGFQSELRICADSWREQERARESERNSSFE